MWLQVDYPSHLSSSYSDLLWKHQAICIIEVKLPTCMLSTHHNTADTSLRYSLGGNRTHQMECIKVQVGFIREYHVKKHFLFIAMISPYFSSHTVCTISKKLPVTSVFVTGKHWQFMVIYVWCAARGYTEIACENLHLLAFVYKTKKKQKQFFWKIVFSCINITSWCQKLECRTKCHNTNVASMTTCLFPAECLWYGVSQTLWLKSPLVQ